MTVREIRFEVTILAHDTTLDDDFFEDKMRTILKQRFELKKVVKVREAWRARRPP